MTPLGYSIAKVLSTLGLIPLDKYRTTAAFETHLLRESETIVGELTWKDMEGFEGISVEYWKLRKLNKKHDQLELQIDRLHDQLENAQESRTHALGGVTEQAKDNTSARDNITQEIERLSQESEEIKEEGHSIKRIHGGLKTKIEVLMEENEQETPELAATKEELQIKRFQFEKIKARKSEIDERIALLQEQFSGLHDVLETEKKTVREQAEEQFGSIGKTNRELTDVKSHLGLLDTERVELCSRIGYFVIANAKDPAMREIVQKQRGLLSLIAEVRASCNRHHRLIGK